MIIDRNLIDNQKIYSFKNFFLFIYLICTIIQFLISDAEFNLELLIFFILTVLTFNLFFNTKYLFICILKKTTIFILKIKQNFSKYKSFYLPNS